MNQSLHYYIMAVYCRFQKLLFSRIKGTGLTLGQPRIMDYLAEHDGAVQKDIARNCHIEPASLSSILGGMEKKGIVTRKMKDGNRRSLHVFLTDRGKELYAQLDQAFKQAENQALQGFTSEEKEAFHSYLERVYNNMKEG